MIVALAADHAGLPLRQTIAETVTDAGHEPLLLGPDSGEPVDYPDVARELAAAVLDGRADRGILLCGSGAGVAVAANKIHGIRCGLAHDSYTAHQMVEHDDVNVAALGARVIGPEVAKEVVRNFLGAQFSTEERHRRRVGKVLEIDREGR